MLSVLFSIRFRSLQSMNMSWRSSVESLRFAVEGRMVCGNLTALALSPMDFVGRWHLLLSNTWFGVGPWLQTSMIWNLHLNPCVWSLPTFCLIPVFDPS